MVKELKYIPWPGWEMVREIGRGTFGTVYEIKHDLITEEERAALKVLSVPQNESEIKSMRSEGLTADEITQTVKDQAGRILREYKNLSDLQGAPNIVRCNAVHHEMHKDGIGVDVYILMELLIPLLDKADELLQTETQIIGFAIDMCHALIACEEKKILHRDIKPENIFVSEEGVYKLGDFGVARSHDHTTYGTKGMGTPSYMAPEVANGGTYNKQADIYSLGIVLYWLLNKRRTPFLPLPPKGIRMSDREEALMRRCSGEPIPAPVNGSKELKRIVLKACAFDLKDRYHSAADFLADLNVLAGVQPNVVPLMPDTRENRSDNNADSVEEEATCGPIFHKVSADKDAEETVGPIFIPSTENKSENQEQTVGPMFVSKDEPKQPQKKKRAWPIAVAAVLAVVIGILFWPMYGEWTEWGTTEPEEIAGRKIETVDEYRYQERVLLSTTNMEEVVGSIDHETFEYGNWGEWGEWTTDQLSEADGIDVEESTQYRFREKEFTTSEESSMSGWTQFDSEKASSWGAWSGWTATATSASDTRQVQTGTQYRYRDKEFTTSEASYLNGWIKYDSAVSKEWGPWSGWIWPGDWDIIDAGNTDTRQVQTRYRYWNEIVLQSSPGGSGMTLSNSEAVYSQDELAYPVSGTILEEYADGSRKVAYVNIGTEYQYRDLVEVELFYYYRWADWSAWSSDKVSATSNREVDSREVYRCRDLVDVITYHFWKWGEWSKWTFDAETASDNRKVETRPVYRSREGEKIPVYHYYDWTDWSEWSFDQEEKSEEKRIETRPVYRYVDRYYFWEKLLGIVK